MDAKGEFGGPGDGAKGVELDTFLKIGDEVDAFYQRGGAGIKTRHGGDEGAVELGGIPSGRKGSETGLDGREAVCG